MSFSIEVKPRSERKALIEQRTENSSDLSEIIYDFRGDSKTLPVISLPIEVPVYRMENCRAFSAQQTEIATKNLESDFFAKGQELSETNQIQHRILFKLADEERASVASILKVLKSEGQREPLLITNTGVVVNGNRRLAAMRELFRENDGSVDERFRYVKCSVLPSDTTADEIDDIEADLQARPQTKLEYDWIGDARLIRRQISKGRSSKEVADRLRRSKSDIDNTLQALDEADLYLSEWIGRPGNYDLVSADGQQIFSDIPKNIKNKNTVLQNASRAIAWSLFENRDKTSGRVYRLNAAFGKLAPKVLDMLAEQLDLQNVSVNGDIKGDGFDIEIDSGEQDDDYTNIIEALRSEETKNEAVETLIEVCETAIELDKEQTNEKAALKALSQANAKLSGINVDSAGINTLSSMLSQIKTIRNVVSKIEAGIKKRQTSEADTDGSITER
ncbi:MAG: hypothetical protein OXH56_02070 [Gemmatimonadetes bacterium]|nr:hypothetical protein [Gemmatimonadota bacterium]